MPIFKWIIIVERLGLHKVSEVSLKNYIIPYFKELISSGAFKVSILTFVLIFSVYCFMSLTIILGSIIVLNYTPGFEFFK